MGQWPLVIFALPFVVIGIFKAYRHLGAAPAIAATITAVWLGGWWLLSGNTEEAAEPGEYSQIDACMEGDLNCGAQEASDWGIIHELPGDMVIWRERRNEYRLMSREAADRRYDSALVSYADAGDAPDSQTAREGRAVADAVADLPRRRVNYNQPDTLAFGQPGEIRLIIGAATREDGNAALQGLPGDKVDAEYALATKVVARLISSSDEVAVTPSPEREITVLPDRELEVSWRVTPRTTEPFYLTLQLDNLIVVEGREFPITQQVFSDRFQVTTTIVDDVKGFADTNGGMFAMVGGLCSFLAWLFSFVARRRKRRSEATAATA